MTFEKTVLFCYDDDDFVREFNRLTGHQLKKPRTQLEMIIDEACDYTPNEAGLKKFIKFVFQVVWLPLATARLDE